MRLHDQQNATTEASDAAWRHCRVAKFDADTPTGGAACGWQPRGDLFREHAGSGFL